jgi:hypothetical protein
LASPYDLWKLGEDRKIGKRSRCDATSYQLSMALPREKKADGVEITEEKSV